MKKKIPLFPSFKSLGLEDRKEIEKITKQFPPYSDYNFASLWSYNIKNDIKIARLYENIVVRFRDYISQEPFYSFFGINSILETIDTLLNHSKKESIYPKLKLIPEFIPQNNTHILNKFLVEEDRDNFDYIFSIKDLRALPGSKYSKKRNKVNKFKKQYKESEIILIDLKDPNMHSYILNAFHAWKRSKRKSRSEVVHELTAIRRLLHHAPLFNLICVGIFHQKKLKGFSITEMLYDSYSILHFIKADPEYKGIFEFLYMVTAQELYKKECYYLNREQDLGIQRLRDAKISWRPVTFLKKYTLSHKDKT